MENAQLWTFHLLIKDIKIDTVCFDSAQAIDLGWAHSRHWMLLPVAAKKARCPCRAAGLPIYRYQAK
jgi:hypothetical protein